MIRKIKKQFWGWRLRRNINKLDLSTAFNVGRIANKVILSADNYFKY